MSQWQETDKGKELIKLAFDAAGMPEVTRDQLEVDTYTNAELADFFGNSMKFVMMMMQLPQGSSAAEKRSIMSFVVEAM